MIYRRPASVHITDSEYLSVYGSVTAAKEKLFNIGAGTWQHDYWTNIDLPAQSEEFAKIQAPCIFHDLIENDDLPIEPNSAELLYTSHVIEHIPDFHANKLFVAAHRSMKPGGIFRVVTGPDADTDFAALQRQDPRWWFFYDDTDFQTVTEKNPVLTLADKWLLHFATPRSEYSNTPCDRKYNSDEIETILKRFESDNEQLKNYFTNGLDFNINSPGDHLSWWNAEKLIDQLKKAGFRIVEKSSYGQSRSSFMRDLISFDTTYPQISLYVEAVK